jgi:hypothetical protein
MGHKDRKIEKGFLNKAAIDQARQEVSRYHPVKNRKNRKKSFLEPKS